MRPINSRLLVALSCGIPFALADRTNSATLAPVNLVLNGDFEDTINGTNKQLGYNSSFQDYQTDAEEWDSNGYNFLYSPGNADIGGAANQYNGFDDKLTLWSDRNGGEDFMPETSPTGGNFLALDGGHLVDDVVQVISGLTMGKDYDVTFWWAAAQQEGYYGPTTEQLQVSLGGQSFLTEVYELPDRGFSGWMQQTFTFTADSISPVLSFLAIGTPAGLPPFTLLDGVTMHETVIPELSTCFIGSVLACGLAFRRSRR